jgi:hypothetical protein
VRRGVRWGPRAMGSQADGDEHVASHEIVG